MNPKRLTTRERFVLVELATGRHRYRPTTGGSFRWDCGPAWPYRRDTLSTELPAGRHACKALRSLTAQGLLEPGPDGWLVLAGAALKAFAYLVPESEPVRRTFPMWRTRPVRSRS